MATETKDNLKRLRAIRSGNRGVVTKYMKEAMELFEQHDERNKDRLRTLSNLLNEKIVQLKQLDAEIYNYVKSRTLNEKSKKLRKYIRVRAM